MTDAEILQKAIEKAFPNTLAVPWDLTRTQPYEIIFSHSFANSTLDNKLAQAVGGSSG
jgi:hypothetical protein